MNINIYADGADKDQILNLYKNKNITGFTTNPTLMKQSGVKNYKSFGYSTTETNLHLQKIYSLPLYLVLMTIIGV